MGRTRSKSAGKSPDLLRQRIVRAGELDAEEADQRPHRIIEISREEPSILAQTPEMWFPESARFERSMQRFMPRLIALL